MESLLLTLNGWLNLPNHQVNYRILSDIENEINLLSLQMPMSESDRTDYDCTALQIATETDIRRRKTLWEWQIKLIHKHETHTLHTSI
jgi:hypothetical protein